MALDESLKSQLSQYLTLLENPVEVVLSVDDSKASIDLIDFINQVASLSPKIHIRKDDLEYKPSFALNRQDLETGIVFAGLPLGHEFESFVLALLQVGGREPKIEEVSKKRIEAIDQDLHFETVVSLSCHKCPDIVQAFNIMSILNPKISHTMIEGSAFQDLMDSRGIMAVPTIFLNGQEFFSGKKTLEQILDKILGPRSNEALEDMDPFDVLVVGGGPAGSSAAIYAARKGLRTGLVADEFGGQVKDTLGIENILGTPYIEGPKFMDQARDHINQYGVELIEGQSVEEIENQKGLGVKLSSGVLLQSKTLIIATGARWKLLGIPGEVELRNKGVAYCTHCDGPLFKGKKVAVVGGGNSGVEAAIDLSSMAEEVILLEFLDELKADDTLQERLRSLPNVKIITNAQTTEIRGETKVEGISYIDRITQESKHKEVDGCFIQVGLVPNTEWLGQSLEKNQAGEIIVDGQGATSLEGVFAAGDCTNTAFKQIIIAAGSGATAALGAFHSLVRQ